tara:strand:- start:33 stop:314 length:282 start_codon:yes stop_codon:yes gene_type:complete
MENYNMHEILGLPPQPDLHIVMVRNERTLRLQECDWTQSPDSALTDAKKAEWATYRQALRDMPADASLTLENNIAIIDDIWRLVNVNWPTKPE